MAVSLEGTPFLKDSLHCMVLCKVPSMPEPEEHKGDRTHSSTLSQPWEKDEWAPSMLHAHLKYYSAMNSKKLTYTAATCSNPKATALSERTSHRSDTHSVGLHKRLL